MSVTNEYCELIKKFLNNEISTKDFESQYLDFFYEKDEPESNDVFNIVEALFFDVDAYTDLPIEPNENPEDYINEAQLRERAATSLKKILALKDPPPG